MLAVKNFSFRSRFFVRPIFIYIFYSIWSSNVICCCWPLLWTFFTRLRLSLSRKVPQDQCTVCMAYRRYTGRATPQICLTSFLFRKEESFGKNTLFENYSKCRIWIFEFWHFPPIFVLLKLTCLVTLFDRKLQVFKNSPKMHHFWHFQLTCPLKM